MDAKITRTRVIIPQRRPDQLSRPRVLKRLFDLSQHKLIIVVAPPGYGKTSLLIDFAGKIDRRVCWYAIDSLDEYPSRFFSHLVASIAQVYEGFGRECHLAQQEQLANNGALVDLVPTIVNELYEHNKLYDHNEARLTLVLDDFHLVQEKGEIQEFLNAFIQQVEDSCQIVIASRRLIRLPDLPLMVARSLVGGISMEDLCFQTDEIQALIAQNFGEAIDEDTALELIDKTEGWITGLLLSTQLSQQNGLGSGSLGHSSLQRATGVDLYDYLAQQVFLQQKPEIQEFLLRTSLLDEFNEAFCQQIFVPDVYPAETDWPSLVDEVVANNLFILPVGEGKPSFRYHNLFQEFLTRQVHSERPQEADQILDRLAEYHIEEQAWEQAYQVRKQQGNMEALADMIEESVPSLMRECKLPLCSQWLSELPKHVVHSHPMLLAVKGYVCASNDELSVGFEQLNGATEQLRTVTPTVEYATALTWRASIYRLMGNLERSLIDVNMALDIVNSLERNTIIAPDHNNLRSPDPDFNLISSKPRAFQVLYAEIRCTQGVVYCLTGRNSEAIQHLEEAVKIYDSLSDSVRGAVVLMDLAHAYSSMGLYEEARIHFHKALDRTSSYSQQPPRINILNNLGVLCHLSGKYLRAHELLRQAVESAGKVKHTYLQALSLTSLGDLWQDVQNIDSAQACYQEATSVIKDSDLPHVELHILIARAQLACFAQEWSIAFDCLDQVGRTLLNNREQPGWYNYKIAMGQFYLARENNQQAATMFCEGLNGLIKTGRRIEEAQTRLMLAGANHRLNKKAIVQEQLKEVSKIVSQLFIWQPLIVKGRQVRDMLGDVSSSSDKNSYTDAVQMFASDLLSRIDHFEENLDTLRLQLILAQEKTTECNDRTETETDNELTIRTLGRIEVAYRGERIKHWHGKSHMARDLFFSLVAHKDGLTKEEVGALFWPDAAPAELKARFKNAIYRVRKAIAPDVLVFDGDLYRLNPDLDTYCDAVAFEGAIATARSAATALHEKEAYLQALTLYSGDYLLEVDAMWAWLERERLAQLYVEASLRLAELHLDYGESSETLQLCQRLLANDPCLEEAHRMIMQVHSVTGNHVALVRQYELCERTLQDEFGAQPSEQTRSLFISLTS